jgi:hypothetical protein
MWRIGVDVGRMRKFKKSWNKKYSQSSQVTQILLTFAGNRLQLIFAFELLFWFISSFKGPPNGSGSLEVDSWAFSAILSFFDSVAVLARVINAEIASLSMSFFDPCAVELVEVLQIVWCVGFSIAFAVRLK